MLSYMLLTLGFAIVGWFVAELPGALGHVKVPVDMNILGAIAGALITAGFLLK